MCSGLLCFYWWKSGVGAWPNTIDVHILLSLTSKFDELYNTDPPLVLHNLTDEFNSFAYIRTWESHVYLLSWSMTASNIRTERSDMFSTIYKQKINNCSTSVGKFSAVILLLITLPVTSMTSIVCLQTARLPVCYFRHVAHYYFTKSKILLKSW